MGELGRVERNIRWIETHCRIPEGPLVGQKVVLTDEQKEWIELIYGSPTRMFILTMARKNAKTALAAFLLLLHLCGPEHKPNSQLYSAAQSREQAAILFALAAKVVRLSPDLNDAIIVRDTAKQLFFPERGTLYRALSAEASTAYGLSPAFVVHDELGQVKGPRSELYDAIETAAAGQAEPLSIVISTQAPTDADLLSVLIDDALKGEDPTTKIRTYSAPDDADPFSEKAIRQANPHFDAFMNKDEVFRQMEKARRMPSSEAAYRNLVLNQRVNMSNPLIPRTVWESCAGAVSEEAFQGTVYVGLDLSARNDLTALAMVAQLDGVWHGRVEFFAPADGIVERALRDRTPYDQWAREGILTTTPGASIRYEDVAKRLIEITETYQVASVAFDRWRIDVFKTELERLGVELPLEPFGQGYKDMTPAIDEFEGLLLNGKFRHGDNPILTWCAANTIAISDPAGNRKLDKSKSTGRIDGIVALVMAVGRAFNTEQEMDLDAFLADPVRIY